MDEIFTMNILYSTDLENKERNMQESIALKLVIKNATELSLITMMIVMKIQWNLDFSNLQGK